MQLKIQITSSLYSRYYAETRNEWRGPSLQLSAWTAQKCRSGGEPLATVSELTGPGIKLPRR